MADKDATPKPAPVTREAKLAEALRANLRRRKAAVATPSTAKRDDPSA